MSTCPIRTLPGQILGYRYDGRPILPIAGGAPDDAAPGSGAGADAGQQQSSNGQQGDDAGQSGNDAGGSSSSSSASSSDSGQQQDAAQKVEDLPEWAQKQIRDARNEAGNHRTAKNAAEQKQAEILEGIAQALGLKKDETPDPAKLAEQLTSAQTAQRQALTELAVFKTASKHQGDPAALLDSRSFLAKVGDLDPSAKDFETKIETAIKDAVKDNPKLKTGQAPGASSVDHSGGPGERTRSDKPKSLTDAVAASYGV